MLHNKFKKKKFKDLLDTSKKLLFEAKSKYKGSLVSLKERSESLDKYYNVYIQMMKGKEKEKEQIENKDQSMEQMEPEEKYNEYKQLHNEINEEKKLYEGKFKSFKKDLDSLITNTSNKIKTIDENRIKYEYIFNELRNQQITYYYDKLKKGFDTRNDGLSWIVRKLMELKAKISKEHFPIFLDNEQKNYIFQIAQLEFELNQLKILLKTIKNIQDKNHKSFNIFLICCQHFF